MRSETHAKYEKEILSLLGYLFREKNDSRSEEWKKKEDLEFGVLRTRLVL